MDPTNTNVIYCLSQNGNLGKSTNDGSSFSNATNGISGGDRKNWNTPIAFDPANPDIVYYGANKLYQTTNAAGNWTAISPDLTDGPYPGNLTLGTITSISVSTFDSDIIYVGTDDGNVWVTEDGGGNWDNISSMLPDRWVTSVLASREDVNKVYVTFSGYRYGEDNGHVYRSNNTGANWTDISTTLPDIPINDIVQDSQGYLYLAADVGVFASVNEGADWQVLGDNLPSLVVNDMHIHEASQYLYIGTYGRSSYKIDLSAIVLGTAENTFANEVVLAPNPAATYVDIKSSNGLSSVTIFDVLGREVKFENIENSDQQVRMDLSELSRGVYYVLVSNGSSKTTQKLIKK